MTSSTTERPERIRVSSIDTDSITIRGFSSPEERGAFLGTLLGLTWVRVKDGRLQEHAAHKPLPEPTDDPDMLPFWRKAGDLARQQYAFSPEMVPKHTSPSLTIHGLCGYNYSPQNYEDQAKIVESYGFVCLRSRRDKDGKFWEMWYLCGLWAAKGALDEFIKNTKDEEERLKLALTFLCRHVAFGSLDANVQRRATVLD